MSKWHLIPSKDRVALFILAFILLLTVGIKGYLNRKDKALSISESKEYEEFIAQLENIPHDSVYYYQPEFESKKSSIPLARIDLNIATINDLKKIRELPYFLAQKIINYRTILRGYTSKEQLKEVTGMTEEIYQKITPYFIIKRSNEKIYINKETFKSLLKHPYINYEQCKAIVNIRERRGAFKSLKRLELLDEFTEKDILRLKDYVSFEE